MNALANLAAFVKASLAGPPPVGTTAADVVLRENKMSLLRYRRATPRLRQRPVLLIPSLINRHYVLDLAPNRSFVAYLLARGFEVYCVNWGTPGAEDRHVTFDDICAGLIGRAVRHVARASDSGDVHLLGYCLGGTLAAIYTAAQPARVATLTALAAPIDFDRAGILSTWVRTPSLDLEAIHAGVGNVPWRLMHGAFGLLRPTLPLTKLVGILERGGDAAWRDGFRPTERWGADNVSFPGLAYVRYIEALYRRNELVAGSFRLRGEPARLADISCPVHVVCFEGDAIVPPASATALADRVGSTDVEIICSPGSHVASVVSRSASNGVWRSMGDFWAARDCRLSSQRGLEWPIDSPAGVQWSDPSAPQSHVGFIS